MPMSLFQEKDVEKAYTGAPTRNSQRIYNDPINAP